MQKKKKKSVHHTDSAVQIIAENAKSRTKTSKKKKKSVRRAGMHRNAPECTGMRRNAPECVGMRRNAPKYAGSAFRSLRRLKILTVVTNIKSCPTN